MQLDSVKHNPIRIGLAIVILLAAAIHMALGQPLFLLNGLGYLALGAALFLPFPYLKRWRSLFRWLLAGYTLLTIILFFVFHPDGTWRQDELGIVTKFIEVLLLLLLANDEA